MLNLWIVLIEYEISLYKLYRNVICRYKGISLYEYLDLLEPQKGIYAICGVDESILNGITGNTIRLSLDHNHKTGKIRGILCSNCNMGLGHFKDNPSLLNSGMLYLHQHGIPDGSSH